MGNNYKIIAALAALFGMCISTVQSAQWPTLSNIAATSGKYFANDTNAILTQENYEGDVGVYITSIGGAWRIYGGSNTVAFGNNIWLKLNSATTTATGTKELYGGSNGKNVTGDINLLLDAFNQNGIFNIYGSGTGAHTVGSSTRASDVNINLINGAMVNQIIGAHTNGTVWGDVNITLANASSTSSYIYGLNTTGTVKGDINISVQGNSSDDKATTAAVYGVFANTSVSGGVGGHVNIDLGNVSIGSAIVGGTQTGLGGTVSTGGNVNVNLLNVTSLGAVSGASAATGSNATAGDVTVNISNSSVAAVTGTSVSNTGTNIVDGRILIMVDGSTTNAITATGVAATTGTNRVAEGINIMLRNSTIKGTVSGGGAAVTNDGVTISLDNIIAQNGTIYYDTIGSTGTVNGGVQIDVKNNSVIKGITGSSGSIASGDLKVSIANSTIAGAVTGGIGTVSNGNANISLANVNMADGVTAGQAVTGSAGSVSGDVTVSINGSRVTTVFGHSGASKAVGGNVIVDIDTASIVTGNIAGVYTGNAAVSSSISGNATVNLNGVLGDNVFAENFKSTILGGYYDVNGDKAYGTLNFKKYSGNFGGTLGTPSFTQGVIGGGFSAVTIDANSSINFNKASAAHYMDTLTLMGSLSCNETSTSASKFIDFKNATNTGYAALLGSGSITVNASLASNGMRFGGDTSGFTGAVSIKSGTFAVVDKARFSSSAINVSEGAILRIESAAGTLADKNSWSSNLSLSGNGMASAVGQYNNYYLTGDLSAFGGVYNVDHQRTTLYLDESASNIASSGSGVISVSADNFVVNATKSSGGLIVANSNNFSIIGNMANFNSINRFGEAVGGIFLGGIGMTDEAISAVFDGGSERQGIKIFASSYAMLGTTAQIASTDVKISNMDNAVVSGTGNFATVLGDVRITAENLNDAMIRAGLTESHVMGDVYLSVKDSTLLTQTMAQMPGGVRFYDGSNSKVDGNMTIYLENVSSDTHHYQTIYNAGVNSATECFTLGGNLDFTFNGGKFNVMYIGIDNAGDSDGHYGGIKGDVVAVMGGYKDAGGNYIKGSNATEIGKNANEASLLVNGWYIGVDGNIDVTFVSGNYAGDIVLGPNSATIGSVSNPDSGNIKLAILDGTYDGKIFTASHSAGSVGLNGVVLGDAALNIKGGTFNNDIYAGAYSDGVNEGKYENFLRGSATANFGDISNVSFKDGVTLYAGAADKGTTLNFVGTTGTFGASVSGFDTMVLDASSNVFFDATDMRVDADSIVFNVNVLTDGAKINFKDGQLFADYFNVVLNDDFTADVGDFLELVGIRGSFEMPDVDVSLVWKDGSAYADLHWITVNRGNAFGIEFRAIPEPAVYVVVLGTLALVATVFIKRKLLVNSNFE